MKRSPGSLYSELAKRARAQRSTSGQSYTPIGKIVLSLRHEKKISAVQVCQKAGDLDARTLAAIEKGRIHNPTLKTLRSLARGLGLGVHELLMKTEKRTEEVLFKGSQKGFFQADFTQWGLRVVSFTPLVRDFFVGKFLLGPKKSLPESFLKRAMPVYTSILIGRFEISVEKESYILQEGEILFFNGNLRHKFYNPLHKESTLLMVTAPSFLLT